LTGPPVRSQVGGRNEAEKDARIKHIKRVTAANADVWRDIGKWFEGLRVQIRRFFKGE
jgi:hypothetical protein